MILPIASRRFSVRALARIVRGRLGEFSLVVGLQLVAAIAAVISPIVIGRAIDIAGHPEAAARAAGLIALMLGAVAVHTLFTFLADLRAEYFGNRIFAQLHDGVVHGITHLPLDLVESAGSGDLLGRTTDDITRVQFFIQRGISSLVVLVTTVCVSLGAALLAAPTLGWTLFLTALVTAVVRWFLRRIVPVFQSGSAVRAAFAGSVSETVTQKTTVDALNLGRVRLGRLGTFIEEHVRVETYGAGIVWLFRAGVALSVWLPVLVTPLVGALLIPRGAATLGQVITVTMLAIQLAGPLEELGWFITELQYSLVSFARIFGVDTVPPESRPEVPRGTDVELRGVRFRYGRTINDDAGPSEPRAYALKGVDLEVRSGEHLAIVGPSGAGKSTLARLIAGINRPESGTVRIGGADASRIREDHLHTTVSLVTQEHHVFVGTVADNLRMARADASEEEMRAALAAVELDLPLEERLAGGARELSPAQAQQLALARIIVLDPQILILDEATAMLDPNAARSAERALARVLEGRTVISIAHRLYSAHSADRVAVMLDGRVAELGSHDELVERGGEYARLWEMWQAVDVPEG
ncbi:ABC transporter ATP-binding protein [Actinotignum sp. GS-2025f]|uniref:ABC transporter ATP-binding protein n=1 Tax=Actinotignum sp. GS-2025f TaxID=3427279 RepID=UPI003F472739